MVTEMDPYAVLGVPRTASRLEVARAYRSLAKRWHPDAAGDATQAARADSMARINQAWHILSNPMRRAEWDARHGGGARPHWGGTGTARSGSSSPRSAAAGPAPAGARAAAGTWTPPVMQRPSPVRPAQTSVRDSGWLALMVAGVLLAGFIIGVGVLSRLALPQYPLEGESVTFSTPRLSFSHPDDWRAYAGIDDPSQPHGLVAHVVSFSLSEIARPCTRLEEECDVTGGAIPPGEVSVVITRWEGGPPPVPNPLRERTFGLDADRIIGGEPAAFRWDSEADRAIGWWQLSPPGFPDRWYEVVAEIRGPQLEQEAGLRAVDSMLSTLEFNPTD